MEHYSELVSNLDEIDNSGSSWDTKIYKKRKLYNEYTRKFTTLPVIWVKWLRMERAFHYSLTKDETVQLLNEIKKTALSQFFSKEFLYEFYIKNDGSLGERLPEKNQILSKAFCLPYWPDRKAPNLHHLLKESMSFPHRHLEEIMDQYISERGLFIPEKVQKHYKRNLAIAKKLEITFDNNDANEWFKLLHETGDDEVIIQNMEYFIAKKNQQKDAWKIYIKFLKKKNLKAMLGVYSRYCRFFVHDESMLKEYHDRILEIQRSGRDATDYVLDFFDIISCKPVGNDMNQLELLESLNEIQMQKYTTATFKYDGYKQRMKHYSKLDSSDIWFMKKEFSFLKTLDIQVFQEKSKPAPLDLKSFLKWNNSKQTSQSFSFHSNLIQYILNDPVARFRLYQTCKYFYYKFSAPFVFGLFTDDKEDVAPVEYVLYYLEFSSKYFDSPNVSNDKFISDHLHKNVITTIDVKAIPNQMFCPQLIKLPAIKICLKNLMLEQQDLTMEEIKLLNPSNTISVSLIGVNIYESNGSFSNVEDVLTEFCHAKYISLNCENLLYSSATTQKLLTLPKKNKFKVFKIYWATSELNAEQFCAFLQKFADRECKIGVNFRNEHLQFGQDFVKVVKEVCAEWQPKSDAPVLSSNV